MFAALSSLLLVLNAATARDTYPRQPVDVEHYRFAFTLSDSVDRVAGQATIRLRILTAGVKTVTLDLANITPARQGRGMVVERVTRSDATRSGIALAYAHSGDRLAITLNAPSTAGEIAEFVVAYAGIPAEGLYIKPNKYQERTFFSDNWPTKAREWLPLIDHVGDKATMEMDITAPSHYQVVSNGRRIEETDVAGGNRRTVWRESVPIAPWLYTLGVARFAVQHVGDYNGVPIETWVFARDRDAGFYDFATPTKDVLAFYSEWIGPYAYEKLANVQSNSVSGGMESASAIFYSAGSVSGTRSLRWRNVVIHEIAHQWFGNAVTESDWNDVWLSEGFATYFTLLFIEHAYGRDEFADGLRSSRKTVVDFYARTPDYRVVHENLSDMSKVSNGMTYQKGSWTLHMLRTMLGDDVFWTGIRDYYARFRNQTATTTDFRMAMERASGKDLSAFFQQWLYRGGIPRLDATWQWDAAAKQVVLDVAQTHDGDPFRVPVELGISVPGEPLRIERVELVGRSGRFTIAAAREPQAIQLDPQVRLLMDGAITKR